MRRRTRCARISRFFPATITAKGETIAKGAIDTGDQVFVDKFTYNFMKPHRGDVFVFRTDNIAGIPADPETGSPFYIKRLGGVPGDTLADRFAASVCEW